MEIGTASECDNEQRAEEMCLWRALQRQDKDIAQRINTGGSVQTAV